MTEAPRVGEIWRDANRGVNVEVQEVEADTGDIEIEVVAVSEGYRSWLGDEITTSRQRFVNQYDPLLVGEDAKLIMLSGGGGSDD